MTEQTPEQSGHTLPTWVVAVMALLAGIAVLAGLKLFTVAWVLSATVVLTEIGMLAAIVLAAGGFGWPIVCKLAPTSAPMGLRVVSAVLLGFWLIATAVLAVGSAVTGALTPWVWWPVLIVGVIMALWRMRKVFNAWEPARRVDGRALMWVLIALFVGAWLAGATVPAGLFFNTNDAYDVLEYHLQAPREMLHAQQTAPLEHNAYSFYPFGVEMLFLLGMALRGGAYEGAYLAKLVPGVFAALAVAAIFFSMKRDEEARGRFAAVMLASVPIALYLSWLALAETAILAYLTVGLLWLRHWCDRPCAKSALWIGLMAGGACAAKYLSVGFVAVPLLAAVIALLLWKRRSPAHAGMVVLGIVLLFSPWLIRNTVHTGNPVFPLATSVFGRGHWTEDSQQRWQDGHTADHRPPSPKPLAPKPPGVPSPREASRLELLFENFLGAPVFGPLLMFLTLIGLCVMIADPKSQRPWDWALLGVGVCQLVVWMAFTRNMPARFLVPLIVPASLIAAGVLARLSRVAASPFRRNAEPRADMPWGRAPAVALLLAVVGVNLNIACATLLRISAGGDPRTVIPTMPIQDVARQRPLADLPQGSRVMLVGEARAFYFPPDTIYATAFDTHPLAEILSRESDPAAILAELRARGVTHLWVDWYEMLRLCYSYGYPTSLVSDLAERYAAAGPVGTAVLDRLGLQAVRHIKHPNRQDAPLSAHSVLITIYALPPE